MTTPKTGSLEELNPWRKWGIALTTRDGLHAITEGNLWYLELTFPNAVEREVNDVYLHLDQVYKVVKRQDRAWLALEPQPFRKLRAA